jgi:hypothetical protein
MEWKRKGLLSNMWNPGTMWQISSLNLCLSKPIDTYPKNEDWYYDS